MRRMTMNNELNKNKPFFCYSKKLKEELDSVGIRYVSIGHHDKTGNVYWLYMPTNELNNYLQNRRANYQ